MYARNTSQAQYGPSGVFAFATPSISCSNPLLTASELATMCTPAAHRREPGRPSVTGTDRITVYAARRSVESGPRLDNYSSNSIRQVIGMKGSIGEAWTYDAYGQYGITRLDDKAGRLPGHTADQQSLWTSSRIRTRQLGGVVRTCPSGAPVCAAAVSGFEPTCVPWNIWQKGGVTAEQLAYLTVPSSYASTRPEYIVNGSVTGDLGKYGIKFPTANDRHRLNLGTEYRQESYILSPDYIFSNGFASGGNGAVTPINGNFHVNEYFIEAKVPIIDNLPGVYHLGFEGGYRYSDYTSGFKTNTFKLGLEWAPIQDLKLRGSYNRAVRAPSIGDLYSPGGHRCRRHGGPVLGRRPRCHAADAQHTGVTAQPVRPHPSNPAAQINTTAGGNVNLKPETADTYTVGFVLQPLALPGFVDVTRLLRHQDRRHDRLALLEHRADQVRRTTGCAAVRPDPSRSEHGLIVVQQQ